MSKISKMTLDEIKSAHPDRAIAQAACEHGQEQAEEFAAACRAYLGQSKTRRAWLSAARQALTSLD